MDNLERKLVPNDRTQEIGGERMGLGKEGIVEAHKALEILVEGSSAIQAFIVLERKGLEGDERVKDSFNSHPDVKLLLSLRELVKKLEQ